MEKKCEKIPYESMSEAREDMDMFEIDENHTHKPIRVYKCEMCGKYHLTSLDKEKKTRKNIHRKDQRNESKRYKVTYNVTKEQKNKLLTAMGKLTKK